jgi:hypothetical protein
MEATKIQLKWSASVVLPGQSCNVAVRDWKLILAQIGSFVASLVLALQMPANNVGGYTKRTTAVAFVFLAYCIGNICGPHAFLAAEAPVYQTGCKFIIACAVLQIVIVFALRALLIHRNKKRDAEFGPVSDMDNSEEMIEDLTDFENPRFRYSY